jgi:poly-beta-1,6-N-acetyl-D-glucosamine biosynthesis protein PgaD
MNNSLIINARRHLPWQKRFFSDASTAMLWGGWLWMCRPVLSMLSWIGGLGAGLQPTVLKLLGNGAPAMNLEGSVMALVGTSGTLLLWNLLPAHKAHTLAQAHTLRDYASHFNLPEQQIVAGRATSICVVHHDEAGHITSIETKA